MTLVSLACVKFILNSQFQTRKEKPQYFMKPDCRSMSRVTLQSSQGLLKESADAFACFLHILGCNPT